MNTIETFKEFIPIYEQIKLLSIEGKSLEEYLDSFVAKYHKNLKNGVYVEPIRDLSDYIKNPDLYAKENLRYFEDLLCDIISENTPHGMRGSDTRTETFLIHGKFYNITIEGVQWNRYDKQYYFIDNYTTPIITIEEIQK